ncbi:MAG: ATP-binding cassette domain-containing protein, partial [Candidatus Omnitrophica bacterium]|nr:ATP-binding cassette domain-containing protein [Candidatus Omnitrophota bacterium]MBU1048245.1 ATP-binding cassette domain-containing protein [Candidatus Omnitrophota bacterium]MBU1767832.1 ATP-binding cassette domain-containing protein [Candidatus Omnitrophota bacterium]MBU1889265.1 ATP-binding cassette domain-containing protein [Candidatus Omnitrophota bacterium]
MDSEKKNPLLEARNITKDFPGVRALDGVTFAAFPGEIHALVGENGAGKSTLIKILAGVYPYNSYEGEVVFNSQPVTFRTIRDSKTLGIAVIHQELALVKHMTVGENILLGDEPHYWGIIDYGRLYSEAEDIMKQLGVTVDVCTEIVNLGVGEQQLVEIAKAIRKKANVLVLDEPTAALAEHEIEVLMGIMRRLKEQGTALIYISHKIDEVFSIADRITVLRDGQTVDSDTVGNWTRESVVRAMVGRELTDMFPKVEHQPGKVIFEVEGLSLEDPEVPGRMLFKDVSFDLREREILGIAGLMGAGRT